MADKPFRLKTANCGLVIVDIQEKFRPAVPAFDTVAANAEKLIKAFKLLAIPILATEQYPKGLGPTVANVSTVLGSVTPVIKKCFSGSCAAGFMEELESRRIKTLCVCGIETHVCIYQTVLDLIREGIQTVVVIDACGSRKEVDHATALRRMELSGAIVMTVEMALFELLGTADHPAFREIQGLVK